MNYSISKIEGVRSLRVLNVFSTLCISMTLLPRFLEMEKDPGKLMDLIQEMPEEDQTKVIRELVGIVPLEPDEIEACLLFCKDSNGVPFNKSNIKNLSPLEIREMVVGVCMEIVRMDIYMVTPEQKKNSSTSPLTL